MLSLLAHAGTGIAPHDLPTAWSLEPTVIGGLLLLGWLYHRGRVPSRGRSVWRGRAFVAGLVVLAVALLSPLDAAAGSLASAHMIQHILLVVVAAPLLAYSDPVPSLLRGSPMPIRRASGRWRRRLGLRPGRPRPWQHPVGVWMLYVLVLWGWHSAVLYEAALQHPPLHLLEHASFLLVGLLLWGVVVSAGERSGIAPGAGVLLLFGTAMQGVLLSALMTFASRSWYPSYAQTTEAWGLTPLADQQLAGVIMWVPGGALYLLAALMLLGAWLREWEPREPQDLEERDRAHRARGSVLQRPDVTPPI